MLTAERLRDLLDYDPGTGVFTWRHRPTERRQWNGRYAGQSAGGFRPDGYLIIGLAEYGLFRAHRLAWLWMTGEWPKEQIDHIDLDKANNAWANLRDATPRENSRNVRMQCRNKAGLKGVSWHKLRGQWRAVIGHEGKYTHLGLFGDCAPAAHFAYCVASDNLHGRFGRTV